MRVERPDQALVVVAIIYLTHPYLNRTLGPRDRPETATPAYLAGFLGFFAFLGSGGVDSILRNTSSIGGLGFSCFTVGV